ncbi:MAG TPA: type II toxin-antitoxin system RelE/ParE family toxin [Syntrophorhabdales bacterium]|nr:type II toxin-antitoxin system RelE/ParE family toxin [Syntrophorhabdales bacterium]
MRLEWTHKAIGDLNEAGEYIALDHAEAAQRMAARINEAIEYLIDYPNIGRPGRVTGTRELVVSGTPFIAVYWVRGAAVQILRILHHSRRWP